MLFINTGITIISLSVFSLIKPYSDEGKALKNFKYIIFFDDFG